MDEGSSSSMAVGSSELAAEGALSSAAAAAVVAPSWRPSQGIFGPYLPGQQANANPQSLRVVVRRPVSDPVYFIPLCIWDFLDWGSDKILFINVC